MHPYIGTLWNCRVKMTFLKIKIWEKWVLKESEAGNAVVLIGIKRLKTVTDSKYDVGEENRMSGYIFIRLEYMELLYLYVLSPIRLTISIKRKCLY